MSTSKSLTSNNSFDELKRKRIFFLEHEEDTQNQISEELMIEGFVSGNITISSNPYEAIKSAKDGDIDILVSDFKMPNRDGVSVMEEIRESNSSIVLVLFTGFTINQSSQESRKCEELQIHKLHKIEGIPFLLYNLSNYIKVEPQITKYKKKPFRGIFKQIFFYENIRKSYEYALTDLHIEEKAQNSEVNTQELYDLKESLKKIILHNSELIEQIELTDSMKKIILGFGDDLIRDLEKIENRDAITYISSNQKLTIDELANEIKNLTPIGKKHIANWLKAEKTIEDLERMNPSYFNPQ